MKVANILKCILFHYPAFLFFYFQTPWRRFFVQRAGTTGHGRRYKSTLRFVRFVLYLFVFYVAKPGRDIIIMLLGKKMKNEDLGEKLKRGKKNGGK